MRQYKDLNTTVKDIDGRGRVLVAANALGNVDSDDDMSMEGSFAKTLKDNFARLKWFLNHDKTLLLGVPVEGREKFPYLEMLGQLNMNKTLSRDVYEDYKLYAEYGKSLEHSIGVEAIKKSEVNNVRRVHEWKLWEYSTLTAWGANENTPMLGIKGEKDAGELIDWLELKLRKGNFTDKKFLEIEKQLYLLRSLCTEPDFISEETTQKIKPNVTEDKSILTIHNFINSLNSQYNGRKTNAGGVG